ncbi:hypothetical protein ACGC1H_001341 [Rhizoctonia solani]|uniref:Uncharacterized protein n=1 Tax=Rhizoctonia solani TaxID=456999 RepID=A0A8H2XVC9_9AGAM|nr:unnamed protein product [Rhizoctonia solani]
MLTSFQESSLHDFTGTIIKLQVNNVGLRIPEPRISKFASLNMMIEDARRANPRGDPLAIVVNGDHELASDFLNTFELLSASPVEPIDFNSKLLVSATRVSAAYGYPTLHDFCVKKLGELSFAVLNRMRSVTPFHGPIRPHTPNRAACRDATSPYPSPSIRATLQTPLRAIPTRSGAPNTAIRGQYEASTTRSKSPCSTPRLSRTPTPVASHNSIPSASPAPVTPVSAHPLIPTVSAPTTPAYGDSGIAIDVLPGYEDLGGLVLRDGMDAAWWNESNDDDIPAQPGLIQPPQAPSHSHEPSTIPGERESGASRERTASPAPTLTLLDSYTLAAPTGAEYAINVTQ